MSKRVAITGAGLICHEAGDPQSLWQRVLTEDCYPSWMQLPGTPPARVPILPINQDPAPELSSLRIRRIRQMDRALILALCAAQRAWEDAALPMPQPDGTNADIFSAGVIVGTSRGPVEKWAALCQQEGGRLAPRLPSDSAFASLHGSLASAFGLEGPAFTVSTACSSGAHAIALAADQIRCGRTPLVLAGGVDAPLGPALLRAMHSTGILDAGIKKPACRPFSADRSGTLLGEAAAFMILEDEDHARARGASFLGFLEGCGLAADGRLSSPEAAGEKALARAARLALADASMPASSVGYVNAHGTGTVINDAMECRWLKDFARARGGPVEFSSTKAATGHCLGATPVLEAIICLMALRHRAMPPNTNCPDPMDEAFPGIVLARPKRLKAGHAMSNSIGFWGSAASLIFSKGEQP